MRYDKDFAFFIKHDDWYTIEPGKGYMPTPNAPKEAVEAIERFKKTMEERDRLGYMD